MFHSRYILFAKKLPPKRMPRTSNTLFNLWKIPGKTNIPSFWLFGGTFLLTGLLIYAHRKEKTPVAYPLHYEKIKEARAQWDKDKQAILNQICREMPQAHYLQLKKKMEQTLWAQAEQIKTLYKDTHFIFIHGQSADFMPLTVLINTLALKKNKKRTNDKFYKYMRIPKTFDPNELDTLVAFAKQGHDHNHWVREILIATDLYFPNTTAGESAASFYTANLSMLKRYPMGTLIFSLLLQQNIYPLSKEKAQEISLQIEKMSNHIEKSALCGNLLIVCIPKNLLQKTDSNEALIYRSHPYGLTCQCHPPEENANILQKLQDNILDETTQCEQGVPQYRLIIPSLTPATQVLSFWLTPFTKSQRQFVKSTVEDLLNETDLSSFISLRR